MRIDLTDSPPPSPKVKLEGVSSIKRERTKDSRGEGDIKQEATDESSSGDTNPPPSIAAQIGASDGPSPSTEQYERKRKAVQDELKGVELEEQRVALAQKRLRLQKALTEMEDNGK
jgi:predicted phage-related endonuclease